MTGVGKLARTTFIEFAIVFASEVGWNFFRKTGQSVLDSFAIALITAVIFYCVQQPHSD
jgi:hypothetical protein